jgi:single-strand DNA-binding protein
MSASLNRVELIGYLGRDPDVRVMQNGSGEVVTLSLATSEIWKDKSGERQEQTDGIALLCSTASPT